MSLRYDPTMPPWVKDELITLTSLIPVATAFFVVVISYALYNVSPQAPLPRLQHLPSPC